MDQQRRAVRVWCSSEQRRSSEILVKLKGASVLTVGESDDFLERGGIINLAYRERKHKIDLEVNLTAAGNDRIKISSRHLRLASVVKGKAK